MKAKKNGWHSGGSTFIDFPEDFVDWMNCPDSDLIIQIIDAVSPSLAKVEVDANARQLIWDDGQRLSISQSVQRLHAACPQFPADKIEDHLITWLEGEYVPEHYSQEQMDEFDRLTGCWVDDHERRRR